MKKSFTLIFALFLFISTTSIAQQLTPVLEETISTTTIEFEEIEFIYGEIVQGEKIQNVFVFTNTGDEPLIITNAKGSCGCTVPNWPKDPILPGVTAEMLVQFDSKGKKGKQSKRVTITANTDPAQTFLTIKGEVLIPETDEAVTRSKDFDVDINSVIVYPNPTDDLLNLTMKDFVGKSALVEIYNKLGQRLESRQVDEITMESINFDVSQYVTGTYTISVKVADMNRIAKQFTVVTH